MSNAALVLETPPVLSLVAPTIPAPPPSGMSRRIWTEPTEALRGAILLRDTYACRQALAGILCRQPGGKGEAEMTPPKAKRARGFEIDGEIVRYQIERHPFVGYYWMAATIQHRSVDLLTGLERLEDEHTPKLSLQTVLEWAGMGEHTDNVRAACRIGVQHALAYALAVPGNVEESFAVAWCTFIARKTGLGVAWPGRAEDLPGWRRAQEIDAMARAYWVDALERTDTIQAPPPADMPVPAIPAPPLLPRDLVELSIAGDAASFSEHGEDPDESADAVGGGPDDAVGNASVGLQVGRPLPIGAERRIYSPL